MAEKRRTSRLGAIISGIGRYSVACTIVEVADTTISLLLNPAMAVPERFLGRYVLMNLSVRIDQQWRMLGLRVTLDHIDGARLKVSFKSPLAADVLVALQEIVGDRQSSATATTDAPAVNIMPASSVPTAVTNVVPARPTVTAVPLPPVVREASPKQACMDAARELGAKWQQDILNRVGAKLAQRQSGEKLPQIRRQLRDDLTSLNHTHDSILAEFRCKFEEVVSEAFDPTPKLSSHESSVDRTLNLMNTARLEDMMSFVDVIRDVEITTHPKIIKLEQCLTRLLARNLGEENNPFRAERLCEIALSTILDNWSGGQNNRLAINDALRESAVSLAAIYAAMTGAMEPSRAATTRAVAQ